MRTCTHCGEEKDYKQFRAHYKNNVVRTLSVCHACQEHVPAPVMGWGTKTPRRKPRSVVTPEAVKAAANAKRSAAMNKHYRRYPIKRLMEVLDGLHGFHSLRDHPYGVTLHSVLQQAVQRLRDNPVPAKQGEWYDFLTEQEVLTLKTAAASLITFRTKGNLDKYIPMGI